MKKILMSIVSIFFISILAQPALGYTEELFSDDFSGDLSQWNITQGNFTIESGVLKDVYVGSSKIRTIETFDHPSAYTYTWRTKGNGTSIVENSFDITVDDDNKLKINAMLSSTIGGGNEVEVTEIIDGSGTSIITDTNYTYDADEVWYYFKVYLDNTDIKLKVWNESDGEPTEWMYETTHSVNITDNFIQLFTSSPSDKIGYWDDILLTQEITDDTPPNITINSPQSTTYIPENTQITSVYVDVDISAEDSLSGLDTCLWNYDGGDNSTYTTPTTVEVSGSGSHYVDVYCNDTDGNLGHERIEFTYQEAAFVNNLPTPYNTLVAILIAAGYIIALVGFFLDEKNFTTQRIIGLFIISIVAATMIGVFLLGG